MIVTTINKINAPIKIIFTKRMEVKLKVKKMNYKRNADFYDGDDRLSLYNGAASQK